MIKKYSLLALQKAINHTLLLDEATLDRLQLLENKVLEIIISPLNVNFFILFSKKDLQLLTHFEGKPDAIIRSSPLGLIRLSLLPASKVRSLFNDKIRISGDVEFGQAVKKLFDDLDIDWEGYLAQFTGDVIAHQVGSFVRKGYEWHAHFNTSLRQTVTEYLQEESRLFPPREEINDFFHDLDTLVLDVERLEAHINQLSVTQ